MKEYSFITRIFTNLNGWLWVFVALFTLNLAAVGTPPAEETKAAAAEEKTLPNDEFDLPDFMRHEAGSSERKPDEKITSQNPAELSDVIPNEGEFVNQMTVGDIIVSPRQKLLKQPLADIRMEEVPIRDALRYLAEAAGVNYVLPDLQTENVTVNMRMPPFRAMEVLANNFGLGIYEEDGLWFIRKKDKAQYFAKIYKLHNIHLGASTSGAGSSSGSDSSSSTTSSTTSSSSSTTSSSSGSAGGGDVVITTLKEILGIDVNFGGTIAADGSVSTSEGSASKGDTKDTNLDKGDYTYVSYNADANTLFIIATGTQHQWVDQYLKAIDNPTNNIAIEAMFLESSLTPTSNFGFDWEGASSITLKTSNGSTPLNFGTVNNPKIPFNTGLISSQIFTANVSAFQKQTNSQVARYPSVVTQNGREVKIETTQNVPLSATQRLVQNDTTTAASVGIQDLGTQKIGTTITITPRQINEEGLVQLTISIKISTASGETDTNTNRQATNETTYEGTVNVPEGFTLAIGGLERIEDTVSTKELPGVGRIPLFGFLFKSKGADKSRTSIFLFITPTVLRTGGEANAFIKPSEGLGRDWIDRADAQHRQWRRDVIDPEMNKRLKKGGRE